MALEVLRETQFPYILFFRDSDSKPDFVSGISLFSNLFIAQATDNETVIGSTRMRGFPYKKEPLKIDIGSLMAAMTYPLVLSWLLPVYIFNIVLEKQDKLREMMKMVRVTIFNLTIEY